MNAREQLLFDEYAKKYHSKHQEEKQKRDIEFWQNRINKCETFEQLLSLELTLINATDYNTFYKLKSFIINNKLREMIRIKYIEKPLKLSQKIKNLFK